MPKTSHEAGRARKTAHRDVLRKTRPTKQQIVGSSYASLADRQDVDGSRQSWSEKTTSPNLADRLSAFARRNAAHCWTGDSAGQVMAMFAFGLAERHARTGAPDEATAWIGLAEKLLRADVALVRAVADFVAEGQRCES